MAKKKKRITKSRGGEDKHHVCYQGRYWRKGTAKEVRDYWYLVIKIPKDTLHRYIHDKVSSIPPPSENGAKAALAQLRMLDRYDALQSSDSLEKRLSLMIALFDCIDQPTADGFRKQLKVVREFHNSSP